MSTHAHHKLIHGLVSEVKRLRRELRDTATMAEDYSASAYRAEQRAEKARLETRYQADEARRAQDDANYRYWEQQDALKALETARDRGNDWEEERALKRLKNL